LSRGIGAAATDMKKKQGGKGRAQNAWKTPSSGGKKSLATL